jgi:hypothetical protein
VTTRRDFLGTSVSTAIAGAALISHWGAPFAVASMGDSAITKADWEALDAYLRIWWGNNLARADEQAIRADGSKTLMFLPAPYVRISEADGTYTEMFPDDACYFNMALLAHNRLDLVRAHFQNYLSWIERFGFAPNSNDSRVTTRSSLHFLPLTLLRYFERSHDMELLESAYPAIKQEYQGYWLAPHHQTPTGLQPAAIWVTRSYRRSWLPKLKRQWTSRRYGAAMCAAGRQQCAGGECPGARAHGGSAWPPRRGTGF